MRVIDCQSHIYPPDVLRYFRRRKEPPFAIEGGSNLTVQMRRWALTIRPGHDSVDAKLASMDAAGIDLTVLSVNLPGPECCGAEGVALAREMNDFIADVVARHPARFAGLAVLPTQDVDAALRELDRAVNQLGLKGWMLFSNLDGCFPDEPQFRPLLKAAADLGIPVLLHPTDPVTFEATRGRELVGGLGLMFDTTIALARLIVAGTFDELPDLKLLCPHVGGALPYLIGRIDHQVGVLGRGAAPLRKKPSDYLRQIYFDTVTPSAEAMRYCLDFAGEDRLLFASDHPWVEPSVILGEMSKLELGEEARRKILHGNAEAFLGL